MKKIKLVLLFFCLPLLLKSQNEAFDTFIRKFALDSVFQMDRTQFPLPCIYWDYEEDKEAEFAIAKKEWRHKILHFGMENEGHDAYPVFYDNFDCQFRDTGEMVFRWRGFTDMDVRYYFKRLDGKWFLVKVLNYDAVPGHF